MKLIFLRHAKAADWHAEGDHARPLTGSGRERAAAVGEALREYPIDHAFVSTAARTRETFEQLGLDVPVEYLDGLYNADFDGVLQALAESGAEAECALVVGHVPSVQAWSYAMAIAAGDEDTAEEIGRWFPTAAWAAFDLPEVSWADFTERQVSGPTRVLEVRQR